MGSAIGYLEKLLAGATRSRTGPADRTAVGTGAAFLRLCLSMIWPSPLPLLLFIDVIKAWRQRGSAGSCERADLLPRNPTGRATSTTLDFRHDAHRHCEQDLQSRLAARSYRAQSARYRLLQALDATNDSGVLPEPARHLFGDQSFAPCSARRDHRRG